MTYPAWKPTLCFHRFRNKHTELSKIYWTHRLGEESLQKSFKGVQPNTYAVNAIGKPFKVGMFHYTVEETQEWLSEYLNRARLHLLVICSANLEAYIQDITEIHLIALGYKIDLITLDEIGKAIGSPILKKASLPEPLKYAQELYKVNYGIHLNKWKRAYKIRCATVHDGGVVTPKAKKDIAGLGLALNKMMGLSWKELKSLLESAEQIATITDKAISRYEVLKTEAAKLLFDLKQHNELHSVAKKDLWSFLFNNFRICGIKNIDRLEILKALSI